MTPNLHAAFDSSDYRQNTYGPPTRYCDPARPLTDNGAGTLANPWNMNQAKALAVAGDVVGFLPGVGRLARSGSVRIPAFDVRNSGTAANRIVFVTKYAAVALPNVATNSNRTEMRHDGSPSQAVSGDDLGTGCPIYGSYWVNYITFDGFFTDMAEAQPKTDSGVLRVENATGVHFRNFEIKGTTTNMQSNPIIYRPNGAIGTVLSNFRVYDFNNPRGGFVIQEGLFSDQYGDQNFLIEHFEIRNTQSGIFLKGSASGQAGSNMLNYGTIRYGIVSNVSDCYRFHALDTTRLTTLEHTLCIDASGTPTAPGSGINLSSELTPAINLLIHHNTVARLNATVNTTTGGIASSRTGIGANVVIRDNLIDINNGSVGRCIDFGPIASLPTVLDYNGCIKAGGNYQWGFNGVPYSTLSAWQSATGLERNSQILSGTIFQDRNNGNFRIMNGHPAKTMSSTGGEIGAYATTEVIGVDLGGTTTPPPPPPSNPCDLNGGGVTVVDVQLCVNQALSISPCTTGDIDQNSQCNVIDVQRVVNAALGGPCVTQ